MKKILIAAGIATAVLAGLAYAQANRSSAAGAYIGVTAAYDHSTPGIWIVDQATGNARFCLGNPNNMGPRPRCSPWTKSEPET
jgi:hypothetical protein